MSATLDELVDVLRTIKALADDGKSAYDTDRRQRWSIERLWIFAGKLAERHAREQNLADGVEPWAELIAVRNVYAHYTPRAINPERVWFDTIRSRHWRRARLCAKDPRDALSQQSAGLAGGCRPGGAQSDAWRLLSAIAASV